MKIEYDDNKVIVYLYKYKLELNNSNLLSQDIKNIFIKLIKVYKVELSGLLEVTVYANKKYGYVLEINKIDDFIYDNNIIDLKINIWDNCDFYLSCCDYDMVKDYKKVYYYNNCFLINIDDIDNLLTLIEYGNIIYDLDLKNAMQINR